jgi:hypothetical protein
VGVSRSFLNCPWARRCVQPPGRPKTGVTGQLDRTTPPVHKFTATLHAGEEIRALEAAISEDQEAIIELERRKAALRESIFEICLLSEHVDHHGAFQRALAAANASLVAAAPSVARAKGIMLKAHRPGEQAKQMVVGLEKATAAIRCGCAWGRSGGFLAHLHFSIVTMSQKSSTPQPAPTVSWVLSPDIP